MGTGIIVAGIFSLNACLSSISTPLTNALNAIGKIKITLYLMIFWTVATWLITPLMIFLLGFNGVALSSFIISLSVFLVVILVKKYIIFSLYSLIYPFFSALIMTAILFYTNERISDNYIHNRSWCCLRCYNLYCINVFFRTENYFSRY